jgi:hypothetical protein
MSSSFDGNDYTIGTEILDSVTTVPPSVRYLSFYAWMLSSYVHAKHPDAFVFALSLR